MLRNSENQEWKMAKQNLSSDDLKKMGLAWDEAQKCYIKMNYMTVTRKTISPKKSDSDIVYLPIAEGKIHGFRIGGPITLTFAWAGKSISLNQWYSSKHWSIRNKQSQEWHSFFTKFLTKPYPKFDQYSITLKHNSRLDNSNTMAMIKLLEDALQKAGIIKNDDTKNCRSIFILADLEMKRGSFKITVNEE